MATKLTPRTDTPAAAPPAADLLGTDAAAPVGRAAPLLAGLMGGAALIHFVMVPIHAADSQLDGALFAIAGWTQAVLAVVLLVRNGRLAQLAGAAANLVLLAVWGYSRSKGLPWGAHPDVAEAIGTPDLVTAAMQSAFVVGVAGSLANRGRVRIPAFAPVAMGGAMLGVATMVAVSPATSTHAHTEEVTVAAGADPVQAQLASIETERCDKAVNPKAYWREADLAGVDTVFGQGHLTTAAPGPATAPAGGSSTDGHAHDHGAAAPAGSTDVRTTSTLPAPDRNREGASQKESRLLKLSQGTGEANDAQLVVELSKISDAEYEAWVKSLHALAQSHNTAAPDDNGGHGGHVGPNSWVAITDPQTCRVLGEQLAVARSTALTYPTAADAMAAGWVKVTTYVPGIAAHYMNFGYVDGTFEVDKPEMILYDGEGPEARVIGLSYYIVKEGSAEPKVGFAGGNDHYHRHVGLCVKGTLVIGDTQLSEEECAAMGGVKQQSGAGWMSHAWVVPGCESPWGIFSGANPLLDMELGRQSGQNEGGCSASSVRDRYDLSPGTNTPAVIATPKGESATGR